MAYQDKRGPDSLRSLNFVQKVACCNLFLNSGLGNRNQEKHMSFAEWWCLSYIISSFPKSPAREVYASPFYRCGNWGSGRWAKSDCVTLLLIFRRWPPRSCRIWSLPTPPVPSPHPHPCSPCSVTPSKLSQFLLHCATLSESHSPRPAAPAAPGSWLEILEFSPILESAFLIIPPGAH